MTVKEFILEKNVSCTSSQYVRVEGFFLSLVQITIITITALSLIVIVLKFTYNFKIQ